jgi:DNA-binding NarL/FixJ family response regulator/class 3 adenylate cyclase
MESRNVFRREGDYWTVTHDDVTVRLKDSRGLGYIAYLLAHPGREFHALDLVVAVSGADPKTAVAAAPFDEGLVSSRPGDAGAMLDPQARAAYKRRLSDLDEEIEEANAFNDPARAARAREERDEIARQLSAAFGIGGKARRTGSAAEKARVSVRNTIAAALRSIARHDGALAQHLSQAIRTGTYCVYVGEGWTSTTPAKVEPEDAPDRRADRTLATLLFTDIVSSTHRAAQLGDRRWRELLDAHDDAVRSAVRVFRGRQVNHAGDSFLAAFHVPIDALECAFAIHHAMRGLGIELRAGIHTGECEVRGDDLGGLAVHIGARIAALAGPGEVLASSTVRELASGSQLEFVDWGFHALRGIPGTWRLYAAHPSGETERPGSAPVASLPSLMLVDDHPLWRETLRKLLERSGVCCVVAEASTGDEAIQMASSARPDVVVMDVNLPGMSGVEATERLLAEYEAMKVLVLSSSDERHAVIDAIRAGASGYLVKTADAEEISDAVRRIHSGELVFPAALAKVVLEEIRRLQGGRGSSARSTRR